MVVGPGPAIILSLAVVSVKELPGVLTAANFCSRIEVAGQIHTNSLGVASEEPMQILFAGNPSHDAFIRFVVCPREGDGIAFECTIAAASLASRVSACSNEQQPSKLELELRLNPAADSPSTAVGAGPVIGPMLRVLCIAYGKTASDGASFTLRPDVQQPCPSVESPLLPEGPLLSPLRVQPSPDAGGIRELQQYCAAPSSSERGVEIGTQISATSAPSLDQGEIERLRLELRVAGEAEVRRLQHDLRSALQDSQRLLDGGAALTSPKSSLFSGSAGEVDGTDGSFSTTVDNVEAQLTAAAADALCENKCGLLSDVLRERNERISELEAALARRKFEESLDQHPSASGDSSAAGGDAGAGLALRRDAWNCKACPDGVSTSPGVGRACSA